MNLFCFVDEFMLCFVRKRLHNRLAANFLFSCLIVSFVAYFVVDVVALCHIHIWLCCCCLSFCRTLCIRIMFAVLVVADCWVFDECAVAISVRLAGATNGTVNFEWTPTRDQAAEQEKEGQSNGWWWWTRLTTVIVAIASKLKFNDHLISMTFWMQHHFSFDRARRIGRRTRAHKLAPSCQSNAVQIMSLSLSHSLAHDPFDSTIKCDEDVARPQNRQ